MNETLSTTQKWLLGLFLAVIATGGAARLVLSSDWYARRSMGSLAVTSEQTPAMITVDVDGAVQKPGVYRLAQGSAMGAAVEMAGGRTRAADTRCINFTDTISDRQKIYIPYKSEHLCSDAEALAPPAAKPLAITPETGDNSAPDSVAAAETPAGLSPNGVVNINTADEQTLETLPGIGPTYARRIVELRQERGPYKTIEEIMLVNGVGESKFNKLKHLIKVTD
jgi:competence protein ComEA